MYKKYIKRILDIIVAIIGLIILSPIFIITFVVLVFKGNGSPFFLQPRPGKNEIIFKIIKFKTMSDELNAGEHLLKTVQRITKTGNFLRKYSIDEIPQLINVLKGDMCLIGPRPLLIEYLPLYNDFQKQRHQIKPGITGWAQVNGRNAISWEKKFELDIWYLNNMCFFLDLKILVLTLIKVFRKDNIYDKKNDIVSRFSGTNSN